MSNEQDKFRGDIFPDLNKANKAKPITDLVSNLIKSDRELYQIAQDEKDNQQKQYQDDFCSFGLSQKSAIDGGNKNACIDKSQWDSIASQQAKSRAARDKLISLPPSTFVKPYGRGKKQSLLPKQKTAGAIDGGVRSNRNQPLSKSKFNQGGQGLVSKNTHYITPVKPSNHVAKAKSNYEDFMRAQAGRRGTAIGDRAIVFSANGTPHYGDSYLDKSLQENLSANQATSTPTVTAVPKKIKMTKAIDSDSLKRSKNGQIHPKGDSMGNIIALGAIAAAVTAVMFAINYVINLVAFILQIQTLTATVTNLSSSFIAVFNNVAALFGLGKDVAKPIEETIDGMLNNVFGKEKVDYVKLQFAKVSTVFTAGSNILSSLRNASNSLGSAVEQNAQNTSKIGNAMKAAGMLDEKMKWMDEQIQVKQESFRTLGKLNNSLEQVSNLSTDLSSITQDILSAKEQLEKLDKESEAKKKEANEGELKSEENYTDKDEPTIPSIKAGDV